MSWQLLLLINVAVIGSFILGIICGFLGYKFMLKEAQNQNFQGSRVQENQALKNFEAKAFAKMKRRFNTKRIRKDWSSISN